PRLPSHRTSAISLAGAAKANVVCAVYVLVAFESLTSSRLLSEKTSAPGIALDVTNCFHWAVAQIPDVRAIGVSPHNPCGAVRGHVNAREPAARPDPEWLPAVHRVCRANDARPQKQGGPDDKK